MISRCRFLCVCVCVCVCLCVFCLFCGLSALVCFFPLYYNLSSVCCCLYTIHLVLLEWSALHWFLYLFYVLEITVCYNYMKSNHIVVVLYIKIVLFIFRFVQTCNNYCYIVVNTELHYYFLSVITSRIYRQILVVW